MAEPTGAEILALPMPENDANAPTVRAFLVGLLRELWTDTSDPRAGQLPVDVHDYDDDLYLPLVTAGFMHGVVAEDGYLEEYDDARGQVLILRAIDALGDAA